MWELRKTHVHNRINQFYFKSFRPGVANLFEAACHNATKKQFVNHSVPTFVVVTQNNNFAVTIKVKTKQKNIKKVLDSCKHHFPHIVDVKTKMIKQKNPRLLKPLLFSQAIVCIERRLISGMRHVPVLMVSRATFKTCAVGSPPLIQEIRFSLNNTSFAIIFVSMPLNAKQIYIFTLAQPRIVFLHVGPNIEIFGRNTTGTTTTKTEDCTHHSLQQSLGKEGIFKIHKIVIARNFAICCCRLLFRLLF